MQIRDFLGRETANIQAQGSRVYEMPLATDVANMTDELEKNRKLFAP